MSANIRTIYASRRQPTPVPVRDSRKESPSLLRSVAGRVGSGVKSVLEGAANTAFDGVKWTLKEGVSRMLDVTAWVAKGAIVASLTATALTAVGASISPTITLKIVDNIAMTLGAHARIPCVGVTVGDVVIIQAQYTGELLGLALKNGIELGAKSAVYTAQAIHKYILKPVFVGFTGVLAKEAGKIWSATKQFFTFPR